MRRPISARARIVLCRLRLVAAGICRTRRQGEVVAGACGVVLVRREFPISRSLEIAGISAPIRRRGASIRTLRAVGFRQAFDMPTRQAAAPWLFLDGHSADVAMSRFRRVVVE